jgi:hypothetical protein
MDPIIGAIIAAIITGGLSLCGVIITNSTSNTKMEGKLITSQAVTDTKIDALREEVRDLAGYTKRVPVLETEIGQLKRDTEKLKTDVEGLKSEIHK